MSCCAPTRRATIELLEARQLLALTGVVAEQLAREVAYLDWNKGAQVTFQGAQLPYTVDAVWHDAKTGFDAYGLTSTQNAPALVLRGSEFFPSNFKFKDLYTDANPKGVGYDQFADNWQSVRTWLKGLNASVDFVGHSLGGALAQWFASAWSNATDAGAGAGGFPVDQVYTFCSPGITDNRTLFPNLITYASGAAMCGGAAGFNPAKAHSVTHYVALGDIVSMAGEKFIQGNVVTYSWSAPNIQLKHILPFLNAVVSPTPNDSLSMPNPAPTAGTLPLATLNAPNYVHNDVDYRAMVATMQIVANALAVASPKLLGPLRLVPALLMRRDTVEGGRKVLGTFFTAITAQFNLTVENDVWVITLGGQTGGLYRAGIFYLDPQVQVTVDNTGATPSLVVTGKMKIRLPAPSLSIPLPVVLGGPITASNYLDLAALDANGLIDKDKMKVGGQLTVLGGVASVDGMITFNWTRGQIVVGGTSNFMNGFVKTNGDITFGSDLSITSSGAASVNVPDDLPLIGGEPLASATYDFSFDPNNISGSYLEGIGIYDPPLFPTVRAGARATLGGSLTVICGSRRVKVFRPSVAAGSGATFDIPAGQQWLLMQATWENASNSAQIEVVTPDGTTLDESEIASSSDITLVTDLNDDFARTVMVKNPAQGDWRIQLADDTGLGATDFSAFVDEPTISASFAPITGGQQRQDVQINLSVSDPLGGATVSLYFDQDGSGTNGELIADDLVPAANGAVSYAWDVSGEPTGDAFVYAVVESPDLPAIELYAPQPVHISEVPPADVDDDFLFEDSQAVEMAFDQAVGASLAITDFTLNNVTSGATIPQTDLSLAYDSYSSTALLTTLNDPTCGVAAYILPDGNYHLSAPAATITNADGTPLATDVQFDFFVLGGDADRNRTVDTLDFNVLAANFSLNGLTFSDGNFNYDEAGVVDTMDFSILAANFAKTLPPAPASLPMSRPASVFASAPVVNTVTPVAAGRTTVPAHGGAYTLPSQSRPAGDNDLDVLTTEMSIL